MLGARSIVKNIKFKKNYIWKIDKHFKEFEYMIFKN